MSKVSMVAVVGLVALGLLLLLWPSETTGPGEGKWELRREGTAAENHPVPTGEAGEDPAHEHTVDPAQRRLVVRFAQAFARRAPKAAWLRDLRPLTTPDLLAGFRLTDPRLRPVLGRVRVVAAVAEVEGVFTVTYRSGARVAVELTREGSRWLVEGVEPIREPDPAGTDL